MNLFRTAWRRFQTWGANRFYQRRQQWLSRKATSGPSSYVRALAETRARFHLPDFEPEKKP
jgi:hypothetical protein